MTDFNTAARQEAKRCYPSVFARTGSETEALWRFARSGFETGARWGREQADAEVRRLTDALAEAYEARDIAQGQWRWYQARAERAKAVLAEVAALADEADSTDPWVRASDLRDLLAKHEMKDGVK